MTEIATPAQIARQVLQQLAMDRRPPTPENYRRIYDMIAGAEKNTAGEAEEYRLRIALSRLFTASQNAGLVAMVETAVSERSWTSARAALIALLQAQSTHPLSATATPENTPCEATSYAADQNAVLRLLLVRALQSASLVDTGKNGDVRKQSQVLTERMHNFSDEKSLSALAIDVRKLYELADFRAENNRQEHAALTHLLNMLLENLREFYVEDVWITNQMESLGKILAKPLQLETINEAEHFVREVRRQQHKLKKELSEVKVKLRQLMTAFMGQISTMSTTTGEFSQKIGGYSALIESATDIKSMSDIVGSLLLDTKVLQQRTVVLNQEMLDAHERAKAAEQRIKTLESELIVVSDKVREDQLTGTLNRHGFDHAFALASERARQNGQPLSIALLDVDNFKHINDHYGHRAGDEALMHLARVLRETVRPNDIVSRHGGEEFLILLPDTALDTADSVLVRLQRELTRRIFLQGDEQLLMTFSAGIAEWHPDEAQSTVVARADAAQYQAKALGKNKVVVASSSSSAPKNTTATP